MGKASRPWLDLDPSLTDDQARAEATRISEEARLPGWVQPRTKPIEAFPGFSEILAMSDRKDRRSVYFLRCRIERGPIKIGVAENVARRVIEIQTACPYTLELLGVVPGGRSVESFFHDLLKKHRTCGEWFEVPNIVERAIRHLLADAARQTSIIESGAA